MRVYLILGLMSFSPSFSLAQEDPPAKTAPSELTEGLLDLLNDPGDKQTQPNARFQGDDLRSDGSRAQGKTSTEANQDLSGSRSMGAASASDKSLELIRDSMLKAAKYLEQGISNSEMQTLQGDIVSRLDEIIHQIEQAESDSQQSEQQSSQTQASQEQNQQQTTLTQEQQTQQQQPNESNQRDITQSAGSKPGGKKDEEAKIQLADPKALQQSVWGQLPEQVRKQMQSKMVEQFLPSYRKEIEAYFQALLKVQ